MNCLKMVNEGLEQNLLSPLDYALNSEVKDLQTRIYNFAPGGKAMVS